MRIDGTSSAGKADGIKKKKGAGKSAPAGAFSAALSASGSDTPIQETGGIIGVGSVLSIDSIGLLAQAGDEEFVKQQNVSWGKDVLDQLEAIKYQILNGKISYSTLLNLKERLNNIPVNPADHKLRSIVQEIEIRAAVELEKLKKLSESVQVFNNNSSEDYNV